MPVHDKHSGTLAQASTLPRSVSGSTTRAAVSTSPKRSLSAIALVLFSTCFAALSGPAFASPPSVGAGSSGSLAFPTRPAGVDPGAWQALQIATTDAFGATPISTVDRRPGGCQP